MQEEIYLVAVCTLARTYLHLEVSLAVELLLEEDRE